MDNESRNPYFNNLAQVTNIERLGIYWSKEEENNLLHLIKINYSINEIVDIHKRSEGGIIARLKKIAYQLFKDGKTFEEIKQITTIDKEIVEGYFKMKNKKQIDKQNNECNYRLYFLLNEIKESQTKIFEKLEDVNKRLNNIEFE